jgi:hypothetical protein
MPLTVVGFVKNGVVVPTAPLPEGAQVEIHLKEGTADNSLARKDELQAEAEPVPANYPTPGELRKMPREQRQAILAAAAELAEEDHRSNKELTGFEAFSEEELTPSQLDNIANAIAICVGAP